MSEFGGIMQERLPELWRFKQYDIGGLLKKERLLFQDRDPNDEKKIVVSNAEYLTCDIDLPGKTLFLDFLGEDNMILMNVLEEENCPPRPNKLIVADFGEYLPVGQFAYVGMVRGPQAPRYVFAVSGIKPYVERTSVESNQSQ